MTTIVDQYNKPRQVRLERWLNFRREMSITTPLPTYLKCAVVVRQWLGEKPKKYNEETLFDLAKWLAHYARERSLQGCPRGLPCGADDAWYERNVDGPREEAIEILRGLTQRTAQ